MREMLKVIRFFFLRNGSYLIKEVFICSDKLALLPEISKGKNTIL